jgi:hypothetical protein
MVKHGRHGSTQVAKVVLLGAITPLMLKTDAYPQGTPIEAFDAIRAGVLGDRSQFYKDLSVPIQQAEGLAREAVGLAEQTDWLKGHGDALVNLAEVLRLTGRTQDAAGALRQALRLYDHKGNLVLAAKARNALSALARA